MSEATHPIRVMLADDSPIALRLLKDLIGQYDDLSLIGEAANGVEAVRLNLSLEPQVIAMDCMMPVMDGLQATRLIMQAQPTRIILLGTASELEDLNLWEAGLTAGAVEVCQKPQRLTDEDICQAFLKTLRAMAQVKVVRMASPAQPDPELAEVLEDLPGLSRQAEIVLIVTSTGGPQALETIFRGLPADFPLPIVIVQHIAEGFVDGMANWLNGISPLEIKQAESGERPKPGYVYMAPTGQHLRMSFNGSFILSPDRDQSRHVPSGDVLLESAARAYGPNAIGVVLTGMGVDGAQGLLEMRKRGAHTIVQDEASSVVFGMPKAAIDLGGQEYVVPLENIADLLVRLAAGEALP